MHVDRHLAGAMLGVMGQNTNPLTAEVGRPERRGFRRVLCGLLVLQLGAATFALASAEETEGVEARVDTTAPVPPTMSPPISEAQTTFTIARAEVAEALPPPQTVPKQQAILSQLSAYGLELVEDPEQINLPDQFMVTPDQECVVQFGVIQNGENAINVATYLIGPPAAMTDRQIYDLDGTQQAQTFHAEGHYSLGVDISLGTSQDLAPVMTFLQQTTDYFCDSLARFEG